VTCDGSAWGNVEGGPTRVGTAARRWDLRAHGRGRRIHREDLTPPRAL